MLKSPHSIPVPCSLLPLTFVRAGCSLLPVPCSLFLHPFFPLSFFILPASFSFCARSHSIWPLTLRNSSAAHFSRALYISVSTRRTKFFLSLKIGFIYAIDKGFRYSTPVVHCAHHTTPPSGYLPSPPSSPHRVLQSASSTTSPGPCQPSLLHLPRSSYAPPQSPSPADAATSLLQSPGHMPGDLFSPLSLQFPPVKACRATPAPVFHSPYHHHHGA